MDWFKSQFYSQAYERYINLRWTIAPFSNDHEIINPDLATSVMPEENMHHVIALGYHLILGSFQSLVNEINDLYSDLLSLASWSAILQEYNDEDQKNHLIMEFVEPVAKNSLLYPQALKDRFIFVGTKMAIYLENGKTSKIPKDAQIRRKDLVTWTKNWAHADAFLHHLSQIDSNSFRDKTKLFRNRLHHRIPLGIEIGIVPDYEFDKGEEFFRWTPKQIQPLTTEDIIESLLPEHLSLMKCFHLFHQMFHAKIEEIQSKKNITKN